MNFFQANINPNSTIRVHPLLVSLSEAVHASASSPDISSISENDERALRSNFYTSPSEMPPLEIHSSGQNGPSLLSNINGYALMSVAGCRECMGLAPQDNSGEGNATQDSSAATPHAPEDNLEDIGGTSLRAHSKGKKHRRASSGGTQGNLSNSRGPKVAGVIRRPKEKQAQKAGSRDDNPSSPEEKLSQEGRDRETEPRMFTRVPVQHSTDNLCRLPKGTDNDITLVKGLKNDVKNLKNRCDMLEKTVKDLRSICDVHQRSLETFRQHINSRDMEQGRLNLNYEGENFELIS